MAVTENVDEFFDPDDGLGNVAASFTHAGGSSSTVVGNFIPKGARVFDIETTEPSFQCGFESIGTVAHDDAITINSTGYVVKGVESDGTGLLTLKLVLAP